MGKKILSNEAVVDIRNRLNQGESETSIAASYGVSATTVFHIKSGRGRNQPNVETLSKRVGEDFEINGERARIIPGFEEYAATDQGHIYSRKTGDWREMLGNKCREGYYWVSLNQNGKRYNRSFHKLVLLAFVGPCPEKQEGRHLDGCRTNNRLSNLAYGTSKQNSEDAMRHGTIRRGERVGTSKLTAKQVREIRESKETHAALSRRYGVGMPQIFRIRNGQRWQHLLGAEKHDSA